MSYTYRPFKAGRALDAEIAEKVMGLTLTRTSTGIYYQCGIVWPAVLPYSTDMQVAWTVMETFIHAGCAAWVEGDGQTGYTAGCTSGAGRFEARADTGPLAICLAALKAAESREKGAP